MAICTECHQEMLSGAGCLVPFDSQKRRMRIPFGDENWTEHSPALNGPCHDCAVSKGAYHHPGCDMEKCAGCGEQRLLCSCQPSPVWACPSCGANLEAGGVIEIRTGVTAWTVWERKAERWDIGEEDTGEGDAWHMECLTCQQVLPEELGTALSDAMDRSWAGR